ncbi:MAG: acyl-CoA synthetase [Henriciella sp.]
MYPREYAIATPDKPAIIMARSGQVMTYSELEAQANQVAHLFRAHGLRLGDRVAFLLENRIDIFPFTWGAQRAGLLYVAISSHLTADEVRYILDDCSAKVFLTSDYVDDAILDEITRLEPQPICYKFGSPKEGFADWDEAIAPQPNSPIADEALGADMLYSSGTTGRPKGVVPMVDHSLPADAPSRRVTLFSDFFSFSEDIVYLCPAPLYHAGPLRWTLLVHQVGGTAIVMEKYDAEEALSLIEKHAITHGLFVPIHFIRMLKLDPARRDAFDVSSFRVAVHAGAPCPPDVKQSMIDWWGAIFYEYYAGSEANGFVASRPDDWRNHPGTVGRAVIATPHICDEDGEPLPVGEEGGVYFEGGGQFKYNNDPQKTKDAYNKYGWSTLGDVGRLDADGYLYLTGRKNFTIISGGVNIYPQEIENRIIKHPEVSDVAVFGVSDPEFGQKVIAIVEPVDFSRAGNPLADSIKSHCKQTLSGIKTPRQIEFMERLPRTETGKIRKHTLLEAYERLAGS